MRPEAALLDTLNSMDCGGLLISETGEVIAYNPAAERCLERHTSVQASRGDGWAGLALRELLGRPIRLKGLVTPTSFLSTPDPRPVLARVIRLPSDGSQAPKRFVLVLLDLNEHGHFDAEALQRIFDFTPAEARLAVRLASGETLDEIAEVLGVTIGTLRGQLKSVFAKTHTHRQVQFAAMVNRLAIVAILERFSEILPEAVDAPSEDGRF